MCQTPQTWLLHTPLSELENKVKVNSASSTLGCLTGLAVFFRDANISFKSSSYFSVWPFSRTLAQMFFSKYWVRFFKSLAGCWSLPPSAIFHNWVNLALCSPTIQCYINSQDWKINISSQVCCVAASQCILQVWDFHPTGFTLLSEHHLTTTIFFLSFQGCWSAGCNQLFILCHCDFWDLTHYCGPIITL